MTLPTTMKKFAVLRLKGLFVKTLTTIALGLVLSTAAFAEGQMGTTMGTTTDTTTTTGTGTGTSATKTETLNKEELSPQMTKKADAKTKKSEMKAKKMKKTHSKKAAH